MKLFISSLLLLGSTLGLASPKKALEAKGLEILVVPSDELDQYMLPGSAADGLPEVLQGLFWMDGNPNPDELISFANSDWNEAEKTASIKVYDADIWSWHDDFAGRALYELALRTELTYKFKFSDDLSQMTIKPYINLAGLSLAPPEFLLKFGSRYVSDKLWIRESSFFGQDVGTYNLRRVVDENGVRDEQVWADYLEQAPARAFILKRSY